MKKCIPSSDILEEFTREYEKSVDVERLILWLENKKLPDEQIEYLLELKPVLVED